MYERPGPARTWTGRAPARGRDGRTRSACRGGAGSSAASSRKSGGLAGVHDVEAAVAGEPAREPADPPHRLAVLARVADGPPAAGRSGKRWISIPSSTSNGGVPAGALGADDDDVPARRRQRARLVPDPAVGRDGRVLGDQQDAARHQAAPRARRTAGTVRSRISMFSHDRPVVARSRCRARSSRSSVSSERPLTCHSPVMPGLHREAAEPVRGVVVDLVVDRRPRPDERHVAAQHVPELRQLVQARAAQEAAHARDAVVLGELEQRAARSCSSSPVIRPSTNARCASWPRAGGIVRNLLTANGRTRAADALLAEDRPAARVEPDRRPRSTSSSGSSTSRRIAPTHDVERPAARSRRAATSPAALGDGALRSRRRRRCGLPRSAPSGGPRASMCGDSRSMTWSCGSSLEAGEQRQHERRRGPRPRCGAAARRRPA